MHHHMSCLLYTSGYCRVIPVSYTHLDVYKRQGNDGPLSEDTTHQEKGLIFELPTKQTNGEEGAVN